MRISSHGERITSWWDTALSCGNLVVVTASCNLEEGFLVAYVTLWIRVLKFFRLTRDSKLNTTFTFKCLIWFINIKWFKFIWNCFKFSLTIHINCGVGRWRAVGASATTNFLLGLVEIIEIVEILDKYFLSIWNWFLSDWLRRRYILFNLRCTRIVWRLYRFLFFLRLTVFFGWIYNLILKLLFVDVSWSFGVMSVANGLLVLLFRLDRRTICGKLA